MTERWEKMVENERLAATVGVPPTKVLRCDDAVKLLARQHRAMVQDMKKLTRYDVCKDYYENQQFLGVFNDGAYVRLDDALAALAKQGGGKK